MPHVKLFPHAECSVLFTRHLLTASEFPPGGSDLYLHISPFRSLCAVPNVALFCSSLISCFPGMLLMYCLSDSEMVQFAPVITGITFAVTFHMRCISITRSLYFKILSSPFLITFLSPAIATSVDMHVPCLLSSFMMSGLLLGIVPWVRTCCYHNMVTLPYDLFRLILVRSNTSARCVILVHGNTSARCLILPHITLHMLQCSSAHTVPCLCMY